ncbi:MAG TPA: response regulator [Bacteroidota bacterium]|jgi:CheY-like chemotaxis protein
MNGRPQPPAPSSPHVVDIQRRRRSEAFNQRLRIADRFILDRQFDKAWLELAEAAKLEPNHPMLDTFKERLECCQKKDSPAPADSTNDVAATDATPSPVQPSPEPASAPLPAEAIAAIERRVKEEDEFLAEQERRSWKERERLLQEECDRKLAEARAAAEFALSQEQAKITALEAERKRLQEESESRIREGEQKSAELRAQLDLEIGRLKQELHANMELLGAKVPEAKAECVSLFRRRMGELCPGGVPSAEDENTLAKLQALLELSREERLAAESDLRLKLYAEQVEKSTLSGEMNLADTGALERLKERFRITPEESKRVEPSILSSLQRHVTKGRILLVDDDPTILSSLGGILTAHGFQVILAPDVATAMERVQSSPIDFILSDITFKVGDLDGFKFFKSVMEQPQLRNTPFVFISGLQDNVIIQSGLQLGADDYLTKPVEPDLLIGLIEGKLKRYRSFQTA